MCVYDEFIKASINFESSRSVLNENIKLLGIPDLYIYDARYTKLWLLTELAIREKGFFISADLRNETNLSNKSVERFINFLANKGFYKPKIGDDKRVKLYYPSEDLPKHIMGTWPARILQIESMLELGEVKLKKVKDYLIHSKKYS